MTDTTTERPGVIDARPVRHPGRWVALAVIAVLVAMMISSVVTNKAWDWPFVLKVMNYSPVLDGLLKGTIIVTIVSMILGVVLGVILAIMRLSDGFGNPQPGGARVVDWISVPLGVATLRDQFNDVEDDAARFALMSWFFEENLAEFAPYKDDPPRDGFQIVGTSGTVTTLAGIHLGLARYDRRRVDGLWMRDHEVDRINDRILSWSFDERVANPCIGRDRADLVLAGCAILQAIRNVWPAQRLRVADRGLREGLLTEMMAADGVWRRGHHRRGRPDTAPKPRPAGGPGERR